MNYFLLLQIALTHLRSRLRQTSVATLGVTFGIGMYISLIGFMTGLNNLMDDITMSNTAHVKLFQDIETNRKTVLDKVENSTPMTVVHHLKPKNTRKNIRNSINILDILKKDERIRDFSPRLTTQVFYTFGSIVLNGTALGIDPFKEQEVFDIKANLLEGSFEDLDSYANGIILGSGLAQKLSVMTGDRVNITSATGAQFSLKVVGIYEAGISMIDDIQSYVTLATAQKLMQKSKDYITDINIQLHDKELAIVLSKEFSQRFGCSAQDYITSNAQFEAGSGIRNMITYAVSITLLLIAGFGIYNILTMMIYEKMDDIAILKATGFSGKDVKNIFISQAMIIGIIGGILGILLGYGTCLAIDQIPFESPAIKSMDSMPINYDPKYYIIGVAFAMLTTFLAGYLPARKASQIDPVDIIRGK
ncbi:MAG: ABC transporter permease [Aureispira sp.]|nr:ABC transporter permease [Aureispira sp.]